MEEYSTLTPSPLQGESSTPTPSPLQGEGSTPTPSPLQGEGWGEGPPPPPQANLNWHARRDSNPRPPGPKPGALSTELRAHRPQLTPADRCIDGPTHTQPARPIIARQLRRRRTLSRCLGYRRPRRRRRTRDRRRAPAQPPSRRSGRRARRARRPRTTATTRPHRLAHARRGPPLSHPRRARTRRA